MITGKHIRELREEAGLSQQELARLASVSQAHIAKIENERVDPRLSTVNRILLVLQQREAKKTCKSVMKRRIVSVDMGTPVTRVVKMMKDLGISQMPVFQGKDNVGSVTDTTIMRNADRGIRNLLVKNIMEKPFPIVDVSDPVDILPALLDFHAAVLVAEMGEIKGIITKADIIGIK